MNEQEFIAALRAAFSAAESYMGAKHMVHCVALALFREAVEKEKEGQIVRAEELYMACKRLEFGS